MKKLMIIGLLVFSARGAWAVPSISGVSGTYSNGQTLTISGSNLTTVSSAVAVFDDFENGTRSSYFNVSDFVTKLGVNSGASQRSTFSTYYSSHNLTTQSGNGGQACLQGSNSITNRKWYVSFWFKLGSDWNFGAENNEALWRSFLSNIKVFRLWSPGSEVENTFFAFNGGEAEGQLEVHHENLTGENIDYAMQNVSTPSANMALNAWHKMAFEYVDSSVAGVSDGTLKWWLDGKVIKSRTGVLLSEDEAAGTKRPQVIGLQNEWGCSGGGCALAPNSYYIDDIVVRGGTISRVIVSTNSTLGLSGIEEEQRILTWGADITVQAKVGMLENHSGATKYLYVCDDNGSCSSAFALSGSGTTNLQPALSGVTTGQMTATWSAINGNNVIAVLDNSSDFSSTLSSGVLTTNTTTYAGLQANTQYFFEVKVASESDGGYSSTNATTLPLGGGVVTSTPTSAINMKGSFIMQNLSIK